MLFNSLYFLVFLTTSHGVLRWFTGRAAAALPLHAARRDLALPLRLVIIEVNLRSFMDPLARRGGQRLPGLARELGVPESLQLTASLEHEGRSILDPTLMCLKEQLGLLYVLEGAGAAGLGWLHDTGELARTTIELRRRATRPQNEVLRRARYGDGPGCVRLARPIARRVLHVLSQRHRQAAAPASGADR